MKKYICAFIAACMLALSPFACDAEVVLVLSGGGTKGYSHLGVMEVLEENGVEVVGIVGTSMGALMGALRASGYSTQQMHTIIKELDLPSLLSENTGPMFVFTGNDRRAKTSTIPALTVTKQGKQRGPKGLLTGDKLYEYFAHLMRHVTVTDFSKLPIPYAAVATDINTGEKVVLRNGNLAAAMRASMSIPALFEPWVIDDHLLVDGGVTSNLPVFTAQKLFPGVPIVAIDISDEMLTSINSYMDVVNQAMTVLMRRTTDEEGAAADILLKPKVAGLGMLDTGDPDKIVALGREAAQEKIEEIKALSNMNRKPDVIAASLPKDIKPEEAKPEEHESNIVGDVEVHGLPPKLAELVKRRGMRFAGEPVDTNNLDLLMEQLTSAPGIDLADYQLGRTESGDVLVRIDVRQSPEIKVGISGYTTNLHPNRWLYLKGEKRGIFSDYDSLTGVAKIGEQMGLDLTYQTAPQPMDSWQINLSAQNWKPMADDKTRDWDRYAAGISKLFTYHDINFGIGYAYEHIDGDSRSINDDTDAIGPTFMAEYDTLDMASDPTSGYSWRLNAWMPDLDEWLYRFSYFKPLSVSTLWRFYFRAGFAEGDLNRRGHAVYMGAAEELYSVARNPIEAERMFWANLAVRKILKRTAMGVIAGEIFASWGYAFDKEWDKVDAPWEAGVAVNFPNNFVDMKVAAMYGSEEFKLGFFMGIPIWDHYPLP